MKTTDLFFACIFTLFFYNPLTAQTDTLLLLDASEQSASMGDTVCIEFTVSNFQGITALQFPVLWDPTYMEFVEIKNEHPAIEFTSLSFGLANVDRGLISVVHFDPSLQGYTVPDGSVLFEACFEITGPPGADNPILMQNHPIVTEFVQGNSQYDHTVDQGFVTIESSDDPSWVISHCVSAPGSATGSLSAQVFGTIDGSSFHWTHLDSTGYSGTVALMESGQRLSVDSLLSGSYEIKWTGSSDEIILIDTIAIGSGSAFSADFYHTDPRCADSSDAVYGMENPSGGKRPYFYRWTGYNFLYEELTGLSNGTYTATLKDVNGCEIRDTVEINTAPITLSGSVSHVSCRDSMDGMIEWMFQGGNPYGEHDYNIFLNDSFVARDSAIQLSGLNSEDSLNFFISDSVGCSIDTSVQILPGRILRFDSVDFRSTDCWYSNDGYIQLHLATEGTSYPPYQATVSSNIDEYTIQDGVFMAEGLGAGDFTIEIFDQGPGNCPIDTTISLTRPDTLRISLIASADDDCTEHPTGMLSVRAEGGSVADSSAYTYHWNNGAGGSLNDSLIAGQYSVTVTDTLGCQRVASFQVGNDQGPSIDTVLTANVLCHGDSNGRAEVLYTPGDTSIMSLVWSDGASDSLRTELTAGVYEVTVTDSSGCKAFATAEIGQPDSLYFTYSTSPEVDSMMNGSIDIEIFGGTAPYTFEWLRDSIPIDPPNTDSLAAGLYQIHITDVNGCSVWDSVYVEGMVTGTEHPGRSTAWKLFPNPGDQTVRLESNSNKADITEWKLIDSRGTIHHQKQYEQGVRSPLKIDVSSLPGGVYFLHWQMQEGASFTRRLIVH